MKAFTMIKNIVKFLMENQRIKKEYRNDCIEYRRWQYKNPQITTANALTAKILRQAHVLEKGMSLSAPKSEFGVQKAMQLMEYIDDYITHYFYEPGDPAVEISLGVVKAYIDFQIEHGFVPQEVINRYEQYDRFNINTMECAPKKSTREEMNDIVRQEFPLFFRSRHSLRQFSDREIDIDDIQKAVSLAVCAPSACNRQPCKVYFYKDRSVNLQLGKLIAGNTGFEKEVQNYLVITGNISAFYDSFERNQVYIDGGIFSLALVEALHYYGIASCILQNGEYKKKNQQFKEICGNIPPNEKIILFIAIGYYKDSFTYAASKRKSVEDFLKIK